MNFDYNLDLYSSGDVMRVHGLIHHFNLQQESSLKQMTIMGRPDQHISMHAPFTEIDLTLILLEVPVRTTKPKSKIIQITSEIFFVTPRISSSAEGVSVFGETTITLNLIAYERFSNQLEAEVYLVTKELTE